MDSVCAGCWFLDARIGGSDWILVPQSVDARHA
jgi:hypothetical protein